MARNYEINNKSRRFEQDHCYFGPGYHEEDIDRRLKEYSLSYEKVDDPAKKGAEMLAEGKIIGWFQGRMEGGPRALGNRSILGDPRDEKTKERINAKVKYREQFRPFAPSVLEEKVNDYFLTNRPAPFMIKIFKVKEDKKNDIPAVTHVDGTSRIHTVKKQTNHLYWKLIKEFENITGIPVVLNTSFNIRGEPIVCTPEDAIRCFYTTGLEHMIIGRYLISKV